jgi:hypothetical protein
MRSGRSWAPGDNPLACYTRSRAAVLPAALLNQVSLPRCRPAVQGSSKMERAAQLIKNKKVSRELVTDEEIACAVWPRAVGKTIANHTSRLKLVRHNLVVEVEDAIWQRQLHSLSRQIVARIQKLTGSDAVQDIEFRIGVPRREPQRAETRQPDIPAAESDEADSIQDPVMRRLYRLSRKKAAG